MGLRCFVDLPLTAPGQALDLPAAAARHVQVRRLQPGDLLRLFNGREAQQWLARVTAMGRQHVGVELVQPEAVACELPLRVTLAVVMPANDRMDDLVEKATELGASTLQPLMSERSVLRLSGERSQKKRQHWQGVAQAAAEQCGRAIVPTVAAVQTLADWLPQASPGTRWLAAPGAAPAALPAMSGNLTLLTGPEGGLSEWEAQCASAAGFMGVGLGPRILRADTAPLAVLAWLGLHAAAVAQA